MINSGLALTIVWIPFSMYKVALTTSPYFIPTLIIGCSFHEISGNVTALILLALALAHHDEIQTALPLHKWMRFIGLMWNGNRLHLLGKWNTCLNSGDLWAIISSCWPIPKQSNFWTRIQLHLVSQNFCCTSPFSKQIGGWKGEMLLLFTHKSSVVKGKFIPHNTNLSSFLQMRHPVFCALILHFCSWFTSYFPDTIFMETQNSSLKLFHCPC